MALFVAATVEIIAYYAPWVDNALDAIATPAAVAASSAVTDMPPFLDCFSLNAPWRGASLNKRQLRQDAPMGAENQ
jgi:hypothetical protein